MKKRLKAVIDTNIFISSLLGSKTCAFITASFEKGAFILVLSQFIIKEIKTVITSKEIGDIHTEQVERLFKAISVNTEIVKPVTKINICRDPEDNKILEAALEANADVIVTGDKDLLCLNPFRGIRIISPKDFITFLKKT